MLDRRGTTLIRLNEELSPLSVCNETTRLGLPNISVAGFNKKG